MADERCPHCGSGEYGEATAHIRVCLTCGYDTENGASGVCPGGAHPKDGRGDMCCDACWKRIPARLPDVDGSMRPWRARRNRIKRQARWASSVDDRWWEHNNRTIRAWLLEHPVL